MVDRFNTLVLDLFSRLQVVREDGLSQLSREEGQGTVEYVLLFALIAAVAAGVAATLTGKLNTKVAGITI